MPGPWLMTRVFSVAIRTLAMTGALVFAGAWNSSAYAQITLQQKLEQIDRTFVCPEFLPSDQARKDALSLFIDELSAIQPNLTIRKIVTFRVAMLRRHQCNATLNNLGITPPNSGQAAASTVRAFYAALGAGQGAAASAMVVPEKRGTTAFSPSNMTRFYGGLQQPIQLISISGGGGPTFMVHYRYGTATRVCDGKAVVATASRGGRTYIQAIRALNGC